MNFAQNGLTAANFWLWPANIYNGTELPQYKAMEALSKYGGDTLVSSYQSPGGNSNARLYITQDSVTGTITVWGMNFLFGDPGDQAITLTLSLNNLGIDPGQITLMRLADTTGPTTLFSSGSGTQQTWTSNVDWITTDMTGMGLQSFDFTINPAELQLLVIGRCPSRERRRCWVWVLPCWCLNVAATGRIVVHEYNRRKAVPVRSSAACCESTDAALYAALASVAGKRAQ